MNRQIAMRRERHKKPVMEELPFGVSPKMMKTAEKYMPVFIGIFVVLLVVAYFQFSPFFFRMYKSYFGTIEPVEVKEPYDFFLLSQQWPGSVCRFSSKGACADGGRRLADSGFIIHHFRPIAVANETQISHCGKVGAKFPFQELSRILPSMHLYWPSTGKASDRTLWQQEWEKFGTCCSPRYPSVSSYFSAALAVRDQHDLLGALTAAGIVPSEDTLYSVEDISAAVAAAVGAAPYLRCQSDGLGGLQLDQIQLGIHRDTGAVTDLPEDWKRPAETCGAGARVRMRPLLATSGLTLAPAHSDDNAADVDATTDSSNPDVGVAAAV